MRGLCSLQCNCCTKEEAGGPGLLFLPSSAAGEAGRAQCPGPAQLHPPLQVLQPLLTKARRKPGFPEPHPSQSVWDCCLFLTQGAPCSLPCCARRCHQGCPWPGAHRAAVTVQQGAPCLQVSCSLCPSDTSSQLPGQLGQALGSPGSGSRATGEGTMRGEGETSTLHNWTGLKMGSDEATNTGKKSELKKKKALQQIYLAWSTSIR